MYIALINVIVQKGNFNSVFRASPVPTVKNNQLKIILVPKKHILVFQILFPFRVDLFKMLFVPVCFVLFRKGNK